MNKDAKKYLNENIKIYKLQRENDVYNGYGVENFIRTYQLFAPNLASLPDLLIGILGITFINGVAIYENIKKEHDLTNAIEQLKSLKEELKTRNICIKESDNYFIKRKTK